jgi:hypothetical protein
LPHSETPGSPIARISPGLFAACHVLHRLSVPRHPPDALVLRLIPGVSARKRRITPPRTGAKPTRTAASHEDTSSDTSSAPCFRRDKLCAGRVRLGHMTNSLFTLQTTRAAPGGPGPRSLQIFSKRRMVPPDGAPDGGGERVRTDDLLLAKQALSQLSYTPFQRSEDRDQF